MRMATASLISRENRARLELLSSGQLSPHDVNGENAALMSGEQIIDEVADDGIWFVAQLGHHPTDKGSAASMPFQIDRTGNVFSGAANFRPTMRTSRLFMPLTLELKLSFELQIVHDPASQRSVATRDDLNHRLHRRVTIRPNERKLQTAIAVATPLRDVYVPHRGAATAASGT